MRKNIDSLIAQNLSSPSKLGGYTYRQAHTSADFRKVHNFTRRLGIPDQTMEFPTILAFDAKGEIIGILSTNTEQGMIIAGPLAIRADRPHPMVAVRLIEAYDAVMRSLGIKQYIFSSVKGERFEKAAIEYGFKPWTYNAGHTFFKRELEANGT